MARKATSTGGTGRKSAKTAARKSTRKTATTTKTAPRKPTKTRSAQPKRASSARSTRKPASDLSAGDALVKLIESPLVADLLAVGATAALAALAGHRFSGASGTKSAVKAAGKAAASAMGRRISTEVEEIRSATKARDSGRR